MYLFNSCVLKYTKTRWQNNLVIKWYNSNSSNNNQPKKRTNSGRVSTIGYANYCGLLKYVRMYTKVNKGHNCNCMIAIVQWRDNSKIVFTRGSNGAPRTRSKKEDDFKQPSYKATVFRSMSILNVGQCMPLTVYNAFCVWIQLYSG